ncbi:hypothetical protein V2S66_19545 [Streptomyces sp. V4-01]|uniref:Uncharacterized protein n=1 Tax=Actinacidiphila polyblastidii TaxID=3110430 RepID=A0ABU7PFU9_9ACTN|nr:hypothetical protein [Streptomyces sp. V4-01]
MALAAFAAMVYGRNPDSAAIPEALARALGAAEPAALSYYSEMLEIGLGDTPARDMWRKLMKNGSYFPGRGTLVEESFLEGKAEGMVEGLAEGKVAGLVEALLLVLRHRRIALSDEGRERLTGCHDVDTLEGWMDRAFHVTTVEELFAEQPS